METDEAEGLHEPVGWDGMKDPWIGPDTWVEFLSHLSVYKTPSVQE